MLQKETPFVAAAALCCCYQTGWGIGIGRKEQQARSNEARRTRAAYTPQNETINYLNKQTSNEETQKEANNHKGRGGLWAGSSSSSKRSSNKPL